MKTLISIIAATLAMATAAQAQDYPARCLIEVAAMTGEEAQLTSAGWREAASAKAAELDRVMDRIMIVSDRAWRDADRFEAQQRDLYENSLITEAEWLDVKREVEETRRSIRESIFNDDAPSCGFTDSHTYLPFYRAAREQWVASR